jgi:hypothetical protein
MIRVDNLVADVKIQVHNVHKKVTQKRLERRA